MHVNPYVVEIFWLRDGLSCIVYVCKSIILERAIRPGVPLNMIAGDGICCFPFGYIALGAIW